MAANIRRNLGIGVRVIGILVIAQFIPFQTASAQQGEKSRQLIQPESAPIQRPSEKRLALVIGNSNYRNTSRLINPVNDARDMASTLKALGFEVLVEVDQTNEQMGRLINRFGEILRREGGVGLFYYAGHGVQVNGRNYLIPIDVSNLREQTIEYHSVDLGRVTAEMEAAGNGFNIVILDACRSNPLTSSWRSGRDGLAQVVAPAGTLIAYATKPGAVASDGAGRNGLYTSQLLKIMKQPGLRLIDVFMKTGSEVQKLSGHTQEPWVAFSPMNGEFYFSRSGNRMGDEANAVKSELPLDSAAGSMPPGPSLSNEKTASEYMYADHGDKYMKDHQWAKAVVEYRLAVLLNPNSAQWRGKLGDALRKQGKFKEAEAEFKSAKQLEPNNAQWYSDSGDALFWQGKYKESELEHRQAVQLDASNGYYHMLLGAVLKTEGKKAESEIELGLASRLLNEAIQRDPKKAEAWSNLGAVSSWQERYAEAETGYRTAVRLEPNNASYRFLLADVLSKQNKWTEAEFEVRKAAQLEPTNALYHYSLGNSLCMLKRCDEAESAFKEAVRLESDVFALRFSLGSLLYNQKKYAEAEIQAMEAIRIKPDEATGYNLLGSIYLFQHKYVQAEAEFRKAVKLQPNNAWMQGNLGNSLLEQQRLAEAESALRLAIKLKPNEASFHFRLGDALRQQQRYEEAEAEFKTAIKLDPKNAYPYNQMALIYIDQEWYEEAERQLKMAIAISPDDPVLYYNMGDVLRIQQRWIEAENAFRQALKFDPQNADYQESLREATEVNIRSRKKKRVVGRRR